MLNQKGFTLIEMIVVIVIMGILSAVAVPKFIDMQDEAHAAKAEAARGAFKAGVMMAHGKSLVSNQLSGDVDMGTETILMAAGWPSAADDAGCVELFTDLVDEDIKADANAAGTEYFFTTAVDGVSCTYTERESGNSNTFNYTIATGAVSAVTP